MPETAANHVLEILAGLTKNDFSIFEDGVPQTISNFSDDPQPLSAAIIIDSGMGGIAMRRVVPLFISITNGFSQFDEMASFRFDHFVFELSEFTNDHEKIEKSLEIVKTIAAKQPAKDRVEEEHRVGAERPIRPAGLQEMDRRAGQAAELDLTGHALDQLIAGLVAPLIGEAHA